MDGFFHIHRIGVKWVCIAVFTILLPTVVFSETYLLVHNTLENNGRWVSTKQTLEQPPMWSDWFVQNAQALARCRLNLRECYGFQEVTYRDRLDVAQVSFDFWLADGCYVTFIFDQTEQGSRALRLSTYNAFPNAYLVVRPDGEFARKDVLAVSPIKANQWNHFELINNENGPAVTINKTPLAVPGLDRGPIHTVGFRGCLGQVMIDDVVICERGTGKRIVERFSNHKHALRIYGLFLLMVAAVNLGFAGCQRIFRIAPLYVLFSLTTLNVALAMLGTVAWAGVFYTQDRYQPFDLKHICELETKDIRRQCERLRAEVGARAAENPFKILFIGTSQTYGEGASKKEDTYVSVIEKRLNEQPGAAKRFQCLNAGICGINSDTLLKLYQYEWLRFKPQVVVIDLSNNDVDPIAFTKNLNGFVDINQAHHIKTLLLLEANSPEAMPDDLPLHAEIRTIGRERQVPVAELHNALKQHYDDGFLWWDYVHCTSFGYRLMAEHVLDALIRQGMLESGTVVQQAPQG